MWYTLFEIIYTINSVNMVNSSCGCMAEFNSDLDLLCLLPFPPSSHRKQKEYIVQNQEF